MRPAAKRRKLSEAHPPKAPTIHVEEPKSHVKDDLFDSDDSLLASPVKPIETDTTRSKPSAPKGISLVISDDDEPQITTSISSTYKETIAKLRSTVPVKPSQTVLSPQRTIVRKESKPEIAVEIKIKVCIPSISQKKPLKLRIGDVSF